jgi:hypothetical protein
LGVHRGDAEGYEKQRVARKAIGKVMKRRELQIDDLAGGIQKLLKRKEGGCCVRAGVELTRGRIARFQFFLSIVILMDV